VPEFAPFHRCCRSTVPHGVALQIRAVPGRGRQVVAPRRSRCWSTPQEVVLQLASPNPLFTHQLFTHGSADITGLKFAETAGTPSARERQKGTAANHPCRGGAAVEGGTRARELPSRHARRGGREARRYGRRRVLQVERPPVECRHASERRQIRGECRPCMPAAPNAMLRHARTAGPGGGDYKSGVRLHPTSRQKKKEPHDSDAEIERRFLLKTPVRAVFSSKSSAAPPKPAVCVASRSSATARRKVVLQGALCSYVQCSVSYASLQGQRPRSSRKTSTFCNAMAGTAIYGTTRRGREAKNPAFLPACALQSTKRL